MTPKKSIESMTCKGGAERNIEKAERNIEKAERNIEKAERNIEATGGTQQ